MLDDGGRVYFTFVRKPWGSMSEQTVLKIGMERISPVDVEAALSRVEKGAGSYSQIELGQIRVSTD